MSLLPLGTMDPETTTSACPLCGAGVTRSKLRQGGGSRAMIWVVLNLDDRRPHFMTCRPRRRAPVPTDQLAFQF